MRSARSSGRGNRPKSPKSAKRADQLATVHIESIAAGGDGVARIDGMACFVPRSAPGDRLQVAYATQGRFARGRILQILDASDTRIPPACHHFVDDKCGGCRLQHMTPESQRTELQRIVRDAMQRVGQRDVSLPGITAGSPWGYRERLTLTVRTRSSSITAGLHAFDNPDVVFPLTECPVTHPALVACWLDVRGHLSGLPTAEIDHPVRLSFRLRSTPAHDVALVVLNGADWPDAKAWARRTLAAAPALVAVWWHRRNGEPEMLAERASAGASDPERDVSFAVSFAQVNSEMAAALQAFVIAVITEQQPTTVIDGYAGRGALSAALLGRGVAVTAVESDPAATRHAEAQLRAFAHARVVTGRVEDVLPGLLPADVVMLNPPRRGVDPLVTAALADAADRGVRCIVYVSCDPATLARDVARLSRWRIRSLQCFDMFPHTAHVETVCVLVPEGA